MATNKTSSTLPIIVTAGLATAIISLFATIFLVLFNPSQISQVKRNMIRSIIPTATPEKSKEMTLNSAVTLATDNAAKTFNTQVSEVSVTMKEVVDWPDTSLGCPEKNHMYAQVITPGYKVTVKTGDKTLEYHFDLKGHFVICEGGQPSSSGNQ